GPAIPRPPPGRQARSARSTSVEECAGEYGSQLARLAIGEPDRTGRLIVAAVLKRVQLAPAIIADHDHHPLPERAADVVARSDAEELLDLNLVRFHHGCSNAFCTERTAQHTGCPAVDRRWRAACLSGI